MNILRFAQGYILLFNYHSDIFLFIGTSYTAEEFSLHPYKGHKATDECMPVIMGVVCF